LGRRRSQSSALAVKLRPVTLLLALILAPFTLLTVCFAIELFAGLSRLSSGDLAPTGGTKATIVVPAHDEEPIIAAKLAKLIEAAAGRAHILLVADNCTDSTAAIARLLGTEVIERTDASNRGKGFALDFARLHLRIRPPAVVLVIDADCTIDSRSIGALIGRCVATGRPCQAIDLQLSSPEAPPTVQLSTFAFYIRNVVRQRALQRLTGGAHLLGTGMAFPWHLFDRVPLATGNIVEDLELGLQLSQGDSPALLVEEATVLSDAASQQNTFEQRRRWEGGYLQNAVKWAPRLVAGNGRIGARSIWRAINLLIPPFALLLLIDLALLLLTVLAVLFIPVQPWPFFCLAFAIVVAAAGLALAWATGARRLISWRALVCAPLYLLWKLPLYAGILRGGAPSEWQRTERS